MFKIGDELVPLEPENDGYRSYYKVVGIDGDFVDVINMNIMGTARPNRRPAAEFVTAADWSTKQKEITRNR